MESIAKEIGNNKTRNAIETVIRYVCKHSPKTAAKYCYKFVDDYVEAVIYILSKIVSRPKEYCTRLHFCKMSKMEIHGTVIKVLHITYYNYIWICDLIICFYRIRIWMRLMSTYGEYSLFHLSILYIDFLIKFLTIYKHSNNIDLCRHDKRNFAILTQMIRIVFDT